MISSTHWSGLLDPAEAAGPWRAQVVSAETKQPLEGVVVLAWWTKHIRSFGGPSEEYRDSQEVLTDRDGRFTIATRSFSSLNPLVFFRGPFFALFKSGFGEDRAMYANLLELDGIVLEMPVLHDMEQRKKYLQKLEIHVLVVPLENRPLLQSAVVEERKAVGYRSRIHP